MRTTPECHGKPITLGNVSLGTQNGAKNRKKKPKTNKNPNQNQLLPEYLWSLRVCLSKVRIYLLISSVCAAKSGSLHRLEVFFPSESHFTTALSRAECSVDT